MKNLVFNVFGDNISKNDKSVTTSMSSCRGWSKICLFRVNKMSSCRGWSKIALYTAQ